MRRVNLPRPVVMPAGTRIGVFNAQSVGNKAAAVCSRIASERLHLCAVVETWHDSSDSPCLIACLPPGYQYIEKARSRPEAIATNMKTNHGGICLFTLLSISVREVLLPVYSSCEVLAVNIHSAQRHSLVVIIYRPGNKTVTNAFLADMEDILERVSTFTCPIMILGDVNIHLDDASSLYTTSFLSLLEQHCLVQHVTSPTHRDGHILDVVITSSAQRCLVNVEPPNVMSDHSFITVEVDLGHQHNAPVNVIRRRRWGAVDFDQLVEDLRQSRLLTDAPTGVVDCLACYNDTLQSLVDKHAPLSNIKLRAHQNAPWYDHSCSVEKAKTRRLEKLYRRCKSEDSLKAWRSQSRYLRYFLRDRHSNYWAGILSACARDPKALWSKVDALLRAPRTSSNVKHSAEDFAVYFRNKIDAIRLSTENSASATVVSRNCPTLAKLDTVTADEVIKVITTSPAKHCELDPAPTWLIKRLLPLLADVIAKMCNASLSEGIVPVDMKCAAVHPRLKKTTLDPDDLASYRPISNLSFISKTLERLAANRFMVHAERHKLLSNRQSAYRPNHSTETAVVAVHYNIVRGIDNHNVSILVLLDLSAAFDTVDHEILLKVLKTRFGVAEVALHWFQSYITERSQTFQVGSMQSGPYDVSCSVPQGSVLGPQEFIAYTDEFGSSNDLHGIEHFVYADDMQLTANSKISDIPVLINRIQSCVQSSFDWFAARRLQPNPLKTEVIWFGTGANLKKLDDIDLNLQFGADSIKPCKLVKDLGVWLDSELSMKQHISRTVRVCFYQLRRLKQVRRVLGQDVIAGLISSLVFSKLDYCNALSVCRSSER